jgi:hypothetical protein
MSVSLALPSEHHEYERYLAHRLAAGGLYIDGLIMDDAFTMTYPGIRIRGSLLCICKFAPDRVQMSGVRVRGIACAFGRGLPGSFLARLLS